jgi:hypothetical protein
MRYITDGSILGVLRGLLHSLIVLALPHGAGLALIALASTLAWRLPVLMSALARRNRLGTEPEAAAEPWHPDRHAKACCGH